MLNSLNSDLQQISHLEFTARQVVEGFITGLHKSPFHGFSVEFAEHRIYNNGEPTRHIDWKLFGRTDKLFVKRFEEETNLRARIVIDTSTSMYFPFENLEKNVIQTKIGFSAYAAAAIVLMLQKQRDAFGISLFDKEVYAQLPAKSSVQHSKLIFSELEKLLSHSPKPGKGQQTNVADALHTIAESTHKRSLVIIFSDMFGSGNVEQLFSALQHLRYRKHEVIVFHTVDKKSEEDFQFENRPYKFIDLESGQEIKLLPYEIKDSFIKNQSAFFNELKLRCGRYNIDIVEADVAKGFKQILLPYLMKREKML